MPVIKIDLDLHTYQKLADAAVRELRPIHWHAEVIIRRALGLPFPLPDSEEAKRAPDARDDHAQ